MKSAVILLFQLLFLPCISSQNTDSFPEDKLEKPDFEYHLRYLASDELEGRRTGSKGGQLAANYIADQFGKYGLQGIDSAGGYHQYLPFYELFPSEKGSLKIGETEFIQGDDLIILRGGKSQGAAEAVFAGHGWVDKSNSIDDYAELDVKGKVVFVISGLPNSDDPYEAFKAFGTKRKLASDRGAVGIVELFRMNFPWRFFRSKLNRPRLELSEEESNQFSEQFFHAFIREPKPNPLVQLQKGNAMKVEYMNSGMKKTQAKSSNIIGLVEGNDALLKNEFIVVSAHYDHVGVGVQGGAPYTEQDSIFNGARDNGMGTVALLAAAEAIAAQPTKRSIVFLACTAEEVGLLGSEYYVNHPIFPLSNTVFNLNNDGAGYNSTEHFTVIGLDLTNVDDELGKAGKPFGLSVTGDPASSQNLYSRSDNINFAKVGIPAIDIAPGITQMDETVFKYYHQATDNPEDIDYDYLLSFCKTFARIARLLGDKEGSIEWVKEGKRFIEGE